MTKSPLILFQGLGKVILAFSTSQDGIKSPYWEIV